MNRFEIMTPEQQRIAIAKACGWTKLSLGSKGSVTGTTPFNAAEMDEPQIGMPIPDYLKDLNAMHEAEKVLTEKQAVWYLQKLSQVRLRQGEGGMIACMIDRLAFATSAQRAEAFLRTLNLWPGDVVTGSIYGEGTL